MSQTLTKPILLDETGQAIKTALQNIDETESQDWLLTYEDVHSELDDNIASIAGSLSDIRDILDVGSYYPDHIDLIIDYAHSSYTASSPFTTEGLEVRLYLIQEPTTEISSMKVIDITSNCQLSHKSGDEIYPSNSVVTATYTDGKTGLQYTDSYELEVTVPSFAYVSADRLEKLVAAHYENKINLYDYWSVGDGRDPDNSRIPYRTFGLTDSLGTESHTDNIGHRLVILNKGGKELVTPINGHTECVFIVGFDTPFFNNAGASATYQYGQLESGIYDTHDINSSVLVGWDNSLRRQWCNEMLNGKVYGFDDSSSSYQFTTLFKQFYNTTSTSRSSEETTKSADWFALPAEKEVFGTNSQANAIAESELTQFEYFKTSSNRIKSIETSGTVTTTDWWLRSTHLYEDTYGNKAGQAVYVNEDGQVRSTAMNRDSIGICPIACI